MNPAGRPGDALGKRRASHEAAGQLITSDGAGQPRRESLILPLAIARCSPRAAQHCTLALPSLCTVNVTRAFFKDGTLPPEGTVCKTDYPPFSEYPAAHALTKGDAERLEALARLGRIMPLASHGMPFEHLLE